MTGALDQSKFGATFGRRDEVTGVGMRDLDVLGPVTDHQSTRRNLGDRHQRIDGEDVVAQLLGRQQIAFVTDHPGDLHGASKMLSAATPRLQVRGRGERRHAANALIVGGRRQSE